jgi:hypothetical protein
MGINDGIYPSILFEKMSEKDIEQTCCSKWSVDIGDFFSISMEAVYVIDIQKRCFKFVANHNFFLCGHSLEEVMKLGYDFYPKVIHPEDIPLLTKMYSAVLNRLHNTDEIKDIEYFSCTFRIKSFPQHGKKPNYVMAHQKLKPLTTYGQINKFVLCLLSISVETKPGNLRLSLFSVFRVFFYMLKLF